MIKSVERVASILNLIQWHPDGLSHSEFAAALGIPHSSLFALLNDLVSLDYLSKKLSSRKYQLGPQTVVLAGSYLSSQDVIRVGRPYVSQLMRMTRESTVLFIPKGRDLMLAVRENGLHSMVVSLQIGDVTPPYVLAAGLAVMSHWSDEMLDDYLRRVDLLAYTRHTIIDPAKLRSLICEVRNKGYVIEKDQFRDGIIAVGIAVLDAHGAPAAGLNIVAPNFRLNKEKMQRIINSLRHVASEYSYQLGYTADARTTLRQ